MSRFEGPGIIKLDETERAALSYPEWRTTISVDESLEVLDAIETARNRAKIELETAQGTDHAADMRFRAFLVELALRDIERSLVDYQSLTS